MKRLLVMLVVAGQLVVDLGVSTASAQNISNPPGYGPAPPVGTSETTYNPPGYGRLGYPSVYGPYGGYGPYRGNGYGSRSYGVLGYYGSYYAGDTGYTYPAYYGLGYAYPAYYELDSPSVSR
jgi:hypothetical protein